MLRLLLAVSVAALFAWALGVALLLLSVLGGECRLWGVPRAPDPWSVPLHHVDPPCDGRTSLLWGWVVMTAVIAWVALLLRARLRSGRGGAGRPAAAAVGAVGAVCLACAPVIAPQSLDGFRRLCGSPLFGIADTCVYRVGPWWWAAVALLGAFSVLAWAWDRKE
ncbi:hypothetical protein A6A08_06360 [Nocardiopsis sp. TSRI0078]|uniref:hypothetical protein n=1 Tax=unclassified Nocardiopsis TaxID=2649073 RepID=UPI00093FF7BF|nr:hypothetical protein [Nocardiopsis sp. TSRI0078]OKI16897.1 hypothetical protein A6A08_06360 [Nocardiopsis sp. TSRI0078]